MQKDNMSERSVMESDWICETCGTDADKAIVQCKTCEQWYHMDCVEVCKDDIEDIDWYCPKHQLNLDQTSDEDTVIPHSSKNNENINTNNEIQLKKKSISEIPKVSNNKTNKNISSKTSVSSHSTSKSSIYHQNQMKLLEEKHAATLDYITKKYELLLKQKDEEKISNDDGESEICSERVQKWLNKSSKQNEKIMLTKNAVELAKLTAEQLDTRKSIPYKLPIFTGNPRDWPMFINAYETSTHELKLSNAHNLMRLREFLRGEAFNIVEDNLQFPEAVPEVIKTLKRLYGRPDIIIKSIMEKINSMSPPNTDDMRTFITFAAMVKSITVRLQVSGMSDHLSYGVLFAEILNRLPKEIQLDWSRYKRRNNEQSNLLALSEFLEYLAEDVSEIIIINDSKKNNVRTRTRVSAEKNKNIHTATEEKSEHVEQSNSKINKEKCVVCDLLDHTLENCPKILTMSPKQRWDVVIKNQLCRLCLTKHFSFRCSRHVRCKIDECNRWHHELLHKIKSDVVRTNSNSEPVKISSESSSNEPPKTAICNANSASNKSVLLRMLPVKLYHQNQQIEVLALLDDGSDTSLLELDVANKLKLEGQKRDLCLNMVGESKIVEQDSMMLELLISGTNGNKFKLKVNTVNKLNLTAQSLDVKQLKQEYHYLKNIPIQGYNLQRPKLLIGIDHFKNFVNLDYREGGESDPIATKTRLGWVVGGPLNLNEKQSSVHHIKICECNADNEMFKLIHRHFVLNNIDEHSTPIMSKENQRALDIMESTIRKVENKYEIGLLWKYDKIELPKSFSMAEKRLECLFKKMKRDDVFAENMIKTIKHYKDKGYIEKIHINVEQAQEGNVWYLPVFTVTNPNKPNKFRPVWDAAAKVNGVSLNTVLLKGPDMLCSLVTVLYKFREGKFALGADIQEMFHQVLIRQEDQNYQRFLWKDPNSEETTEIFIMKVMTFGAACSPTCAQYVKNKNAQNFEVEFPEAASAIINQHYVDDYIDSFKSVEEAVRIAKQVEYIHEQGGFKIRNWVSNSTKIIESMGMEAKFAPKDLDIDNTTYMEKVLGLWWQPKIDKFSFRINYVRLGKEYFIGDKIPTKRIILKVLMSIYDPLGLISFFLINLKILLQDVWRTNIDWDEEINKEHQMRWKHWTNSINSLGKLQINRCYSLKLSDDTLNKIIDLHVFCDAGERAYTAIAYIRIEDSNGVDVALIGSKNKIAPLNPLSVPRLELLAAELAARLSNQIIQSHHIKFNRKILWTDSTTVLKWLNGDPRNYKQFVMFRVGNILNITTTKEWRWIPTNANPADLATKIIHHPEEVSKKWVNGPEFMYKSEDQWPGKEWTEKTTTTEELKVNVHTNTIRSQPIIAINYDNYSKWERLVRVNAWVNRFCNNLKNKIKNSDSNVCHGKILLCKEIIESESQLYRTAQNETYYEEVYQLNNNNRINKTSKIKSFSPYLDSDKVMRVKGRIDALGIIDEHTKKPIILPRKHRITELIIDYYHRLYLHQNHETVINQLKQKYAIPQIRVAVRSVRKNCQVCKILNAKPQPPEEAALPKARLSPFCRPFTYTGVDFFGPINIINGRKQEKRYGVLFTCMTVRAIHLEVAHSLSTDSFILTLRNFIARRGTPVEIRCDNGTNFHGSKNELEKTIREINDEKIREKFQMIKWTFNPPASPHMGGVWERLIQTVKKNIMKVLPSRAPTDEMLKSCLCEVEMIVNSRPLTYVPVEVDAPEAITPNHFLLGSSGGQKPAGKFDINLNPLALRQQWKISQQIGEKFWKRWVNEYAPTLTRRTKWFDPVKPIEVGDIVVIIDENLPRNEWPMGRIVETKPGQDGQVRQAIIKTSNGFLTRPATKIAVLDVSN